MAVLSALFGNIIFFVWFSIIRIVNKNVFEYIFFTFRLNLTDKIVKIAIQ